MSNKQGIYIVANNEMIANDIWSMTLLGDSSAITAPGQFVNILLEGRYLRRPISVCDWEYDSITLVYKVVGVGTQQMSELTKGAALDLLVGLGNGFSVEDCGEQPLLIGGGVGIPPMYGLAKSLCAVGKTPTVVLGFRTGEDVFYKTRFQALGCKTYITTEDGSAGTRGFVTDCIRSERFSYDSYCACGPEPMLRAVHTLCGDNGQLSFEERMGCGFGACMGCSCETKYGYKRICKDGPILKGGEVKW